MIRLVLDTKACMAELLLRTAFDEFLFIEGEITTFNRFTIDGLIHREFYGDTTDPDSGDTPRNEKESGAQGRLAYSAWKSLREYCFSIIKGKRTPLDFKLIFSLPDPAIETLIRKEQLDFQPETVQGLYLNFRYDGNVLTCTTGTSLSTFTMDKSLEHAFDQWTRRFFFDHHINWEE